jgi:hypothetical protein
MGVGFEDFLPGREGHVGGNAPDNRLFFADIDGAPIAAGLSPTGSTLRRAPTHRRSGRPAIAIDCGRTARGSVPSTSVTLLESCHHF